MSASEIKSFEDLWQKIMEIFYAILDFFRGAGIHDVEIGTTEVNIDGFKPVYPTK